jgi:hypothetical protein
MVINQADGNYQWLRAAMKFAQENELEGDAKSEITKLREAYIEGCYRECRGMGLVNMVITKVSAEQKFDEATHPKHEIITSSDLDEKIDTVFNDLCQEHAIFDDVKCKVISSSDWVGHHLTGGPQTQLEKSRKPEFLSACKHIIRNEYADALVVKANERASQAIIDRLIQEGYVPPGPAGDATVQPKKKRKKDKKLVSDPIRDPGQFYDATDNSAAQTKPENEACWFCYSETCWSSICEWNPKSPAGLARGIAEAELALAKATEAATNASQTPGKGKGKGKGQGGKGAGKQTEQNIPPPAGKGKPAPAGKGKGKSKGKGKPALKGKEKSTSKGKGKSALKGKGHPTSKGKGKGKSKSKGKPKGKPYGK